MSKAGIPVAKGTNKPISDHKEALAIASEIGFPLMIKAASGGGGIGMQVVNEKSDFESALRLCQGRAESAFGDSRVFIEEYIDSAEHIEFQVVGDGSTAIHLGERFRLGGGTEKKIKIFTKTWKTKKLQKTSKRSMKNR